MSAPNQPADEQLIARLRAGDQAALATLYERHRRSLFRFAMNMTAGNAALSDEVVQDSFLALINNPAGYDPVRRGLRVYLLGIAQKQLYRRLNQNRRTAQLSDTGAECEPVWTQPQEDPLQALEREERTTLVRLAVDALPPVYREIIALCQWEEMSYEEASEVLDVSIGTVRSRLHRARSLLLEKLSRAQPAKATLLAHETGRRK
jgi:RNA polymerase sigma-70 factor (ECF subfamily)